MINWAQDFDSHAVAKGQAMLLKKVEMKIWYFEGFQVRLVEIKGSRDVRGGQGNVGNYNFKRQAKNNLTVKKFIGARLKRFEQYGWTGQVVLGNGSTAHGDTSLENVRQSYTYFKEISPERGCPTFHCQVLSE